jgi:hypothetical protein
VGTVAADMIALLERLENAGPLPRVRALHVPPPKADGTRAGRFCAVELDDGALGGRWALPRSTRSRATCIGGRAMSRRQRSTRSATSTSDPAIGWAWSAWVRRWCRRRSRGFEQLLARARRG